MHTPLDQFLVKKLIPIHVAGFDLSFTNSALFTVLATLLIIAFQIGGLWGRSLVPSRLQALLETSFDFISSMVDENVGKAARPYAPLIFSIFLFIFFANILGMMPYSFTVTSHFAITFTFAFLLFLMMTVLGLVRHGWKFFSLFYPEGAPWWMAPLLVPLEVMSYLTRPLTLSMRLFLNMTAGHILLKVFAGFAVTLGIWAFAPVLFNVIFIGFEFFVAMLQAYIFTMLTCIYLNDAINLH